MSDASRRVIFGSSGAVLSVAALATVDAGAVLVVMDKGLSGLGGALRGSFNPADQPDSILLRVLLSPSSGSATSPFAMQAAKISSRQSGSSPPA